MAGPRTPRHSELPLLELLYAASREEFGVVVATEDVGRLRQRLYKLQKTDPDLNRLSLMESPTNPAGELWIVKK